MSERLNCFYLQDGQYLVRSVSYQEAPEDILQADAGVISRLSLDVYCGRKRKCKTGVEFSLRVAEQDLCKHTCRRISNDLVIQYPEWRRPGRTGCKAQYSFSYECRPGCARDFV